MAGRAVLRYVSHDPRPVGLPGYGSPAPTVVEPGDTFTVDADSLGLWTGPRFEVVEDDTVDPGPSRHQSATKAELGAYLDLDDAEVGRLRHDDLVALADAHDRLNPPPPFEGTDQEGSTPR